MTLFTDNPFEKMMIQRPGGRRDNAPPVPHSPACVSCPYNGNAERRIFSWHLDL